MNDIFIVLFKLLFLKGIHLCIWFDSNKIFDRKLLLLLLPLLYEIISTSLMNVIK